MIDQASKVSNGRSKLELLKRDCKGKVYNDFLEIGKVVEKVLPIEEDLVDFLEIKEVPSLAALEQQDMPHEAHPLSSQRGLSWQFLGFWERSLRPKTA